MLQIFKGDCQIPKWLSPAAQDLLKRILQPNPMKRINVAGIREHEWFKKDYVPAVPHDDDEDVLPSPAPSIKEVCKAVRGERMGGTTPFFWFLVLIKADCFGFFFLKPIDEPAQEKCTPINAFQLIGMASSLDLSGFFEEEVCVLFCTVH